MNEEARENPKKIEGFCGLKERINVIEKKDQIEGKIIVVDPHKIMQQSYQDFNNKQSKVKNIVVQTDKKNGNFNKFLIFNDCIFRRCDQVTTIKVKMRKVNHLFI